MLRRLFSTIGFFLAVTSAQGQGSPPNQAEQQRILLDRIQQLEKRVSELETGKRRNCSNLYTPCA